MAAHVVLAAARQPVRQADCDLKTAAMMLGTSGTTMGMISMTWGTLSMELETVGPQ